MVSAIQINAWCREIHKWSAAKGWYQKGMYKDPLQVSSKLALIHSEVSEALEALRENRLDSYEGEKGKPEGLITELADVVIRCMDLAEGLRVDGQVNISLQEAIATKMAYNTKRPYKHGGKVI